jgi:hypothetical protein
MDDDHHFAFAYKQTKIPQKNQKKKENKKQKTL